MNEFKGESCETTTMNKAKDEQNGDIEQEG